MAFFSYAKVSRDYASLTWKSILDVLKVVDAKPLSRVHGNATAESVCPVCRGVFTAAHSGEHPAKMHQFCDACWGNRKVDCEFFAAMCEDNV